MKIIAPSILSADGSRLSEEIAAVEKAGADWIHIDVMDGHFVPNITIGPAIISTLRKTTKLPFDVHLMIENPERYIESFAQAGADIITVHVEATNHLHRTIDMIKKLGQEAGVSLNPATPLTQIEEIIPYIDLLLIMTVNPGFGGQQFIKTSLSKIARANKMLTGLSRKPLLEVDGGVNLKNIGDIAQVGADVLVAGAAIFGSDDYQKTISSLKLAANNTGFYPQRKTVKHFCLSTAYHRAGNRTDFIKFILARRKAKDVWRQPKPYLILRLRLMDDASAKYFVGQLTSATV
jgi:ribulose-phosphate 3-epimerase